MEQTQTQPEIKVAMIYNDGWSNGDFNKLFVEATAWLNGRTIWIDREEYNGSTAMGINADDLFGLVGHLTSNKVKTTGQELEQLFRELMDTAHLFENTNDETLENQFAKPHAGYLYGLTTTEDKWESLKSDVIKSVEAKFDPEMGPNGGGQVYFKDQVIQLNYRYWGPDDLDKTEED